ncbi:MAG: hypothetical protein KC502_00250 [Myxococcales bacterium]|nr:hypothetical protein [Myxococcales bacterium]
MSELREVIGRVSVLVALLFMAGCPSETVAPTPVAKDPLKGWSVLAGKYAGGGLTAAWSSGAGGTARSWVLVGGDGKDGIILELNKGAWTQHKVPGAGLLWWVHGDAAGHRIAVGDRGTIVSWTSGDAAPKIIQIAELEKSNVALYGVWFAEGAETLWVVGGNPKAGPGSGVLWSIARADLSGDPGAKAKRVDVGADQGILFKVIGAGGERWAVGDGGKIWHGTGDKWAIEHTAKTDVLIGISGTKPTELVTVGGRGAGVVIRRDADGWKQVAGGDGAWISGLSAVVRLADGTALVGGNYGFLGKQDATTDPTDLPAVTPPLTDLTLHGSWADKHTQVVVGGSFDNPTQPIIGCLLMRGAALPALPSP